MFTCVALRMYGLHHKFHVWFTRDSSLQRRVLDALEGRTFDSDGRDALIHTHIHTHIYSDIFSKQLFRTFHII